MRCRVSRDSRRIERAFLFITMPGWIKIHRQFLDHWLCNEHRPLTRREAWENMLLYANYAEIDVLIKGQVIKCGRGQLIYSLETLSKKFNWSIGATRHFLKLLQKDNMIIVEGLKYTTRLTICNYDRYQDEQQTDNKLTTNCEHSENILTTTREEGKERKEVKNGKKFMPPSIEEIKLKMVERGLTSFTAEAFHAHYNANGWMVGRNKMKDWNSALTTWNEKSKQYANNSGTDRRSIKRTNNLWN